MKARFLERMLKRTTPKPLLENKEGSPANAKLRPNQSINRNSFPNLGKVPGGRKG